MISFDEALDRVRLAAQPCGTECVAIDAAGNRVLSAPVVAQLAAPRCDVSAMDGYAVRDADLSGFPAQLNIKGKSFCPLADACLGPVQSSLALFRDEYEYLAEHGTPKYTKTTWWA